MSALSICTVQSVDVPSGRVTTSCSLGHVNDETVEGIRTIWKNRYMGAPVTTPAKWAGMQVPCPVCEALEAMMPAPSPSWGFPLAASGTYKFPRISLEFGGSGTL
jgi:hypothetical protein